MSSMTGTARPAHARSEGLPPTTPPPSTAPPSAPPTRARSARRCVPAGERVIAGILASGCLAVLATAAWLTPSPNGHGTHEQMGLPPCGWAMATGRPCPTCGMTTAFAWTLHLNWAAAGRAQPMGLLLALIAAAVFWGALHVAVFGSRLGRIGGTLLRPRVLWGLAACWALSWLYTAWTWKG